MRKLTYKQAATCGENLKARVTTEQSEKMQLAWFAAGKTWQNLHTDIIRNEAKPHLFLDDYLSNGDDYDFKRDRNEQIELIDDLPQPDFASQQEVTLWVAQGNKAEFITGDVVGFKGGVLWNFSKNQKTDYCFSAPSHWKKHTPPRLIRVNGVEVPAPLESFDGLANDVNVWAVYLPKYDGGEDSVCQVSILCGLAKTALKQGLCYTTKEDAIKRAEAMAKFEVAE